MKQKTILTWTLAFFVALAAVYIHQGPVVASKDTVYHHAAVEAKIRTIILDKYYREVDDERLHQGALKGMFSVLDSYSGYIPPQKLQDFDLDTTGKFGGLGIIIEVRDHILTVVTPLEGSPAHKAGILAGDKIIKIKYQKKGQWVERDGDFESTDDARQVLIGPVGTSVILSVIHEESGKREDITISRDTITVRSVKGAKILDKKNGIGYVRVIAFQMETNDELLKVLDSFKAEGVKSLILDLRFNPGGLLDQAIAMADHFLKEGVIVQMRGRAEKSKVVYATSSGHGQFLEKIIVLINRGSASASEIVGGALQDSKRALLVGERSWGKGSVQSIIEVPESRDAEGNIVYSKIKLTTALYYTPSGKSIHRIIQKEKNSDEKEEGGLSPNVEVKITAEDELTLMRLRSEEDIQSEKGRVRGRNLEEAAETNHAEVEKEFYRFLEAAQDLEMMEWERSKLNHKLFIDQVLQRSVEILRSPSEYERILNKR